MLSPHFPCIRKKLTIIFGAEWAIVYLIPPLNEIRHNRSYLRRLTAVQAFSLIATAMESELAQTEVLPIILEMAADDVSADMGDKKRNRMIFLLH